MEKTKLIIFEGMHQIGKTTLLNELSENHGVLNLYQDTSFWDGTTRPITDDSELYYRQFSASLKNQGHLVSELAKTNHYHTILVDRWYLSSLFWTIKNIKHVGDFPSMDKLLDYVKDFEKVLHEKVPTYNIIFGTTFTNLVDKTTYDVGLNTGEYNCIKHLCESELDFNDRKIFLDVDNVDGTWNIRDKFIEFLKSRQ